ncbi:MAG: ATP-grasp domain-containing protein [Gammaproteobacteria bacterium]|nr:ATP-grasp domain-containing protein [Gammaproteobacteria bacterium]MCP5136525.1 ATP-grasp domain-containing protein [Gammaproteobacteria bacterium]
MDISRLHVLLVSSTPSLTWLATGCLNRVGIKPSLLTSTDFRLPRLLRRTRVHESFHPADATGHADDDLGAYSERLVARVEDFCRRHKVDVVLPVDLRCILPMGEHWQSDAPARLFPVAAPVDIRLLHDKWHFSTLCKERGLPQPASELIARDEDIDALPLRYPIVVKPLNRANSAGIYRLDSAPAVHAHLRSGLPFSAPPLLAQEFIPGRDMGCSLLADRGEIKAFTIFRQYKLGRAFTEHAGIEAMARELVSAMRFHGIGHIDLREDRRDRSAKLFEINPRVWGSILYSARAGVNFLELGIRQTLGEDIATVFKPLRPRWVRVSARDRLGNRINELMSRR